MLTQLYPFLDPIHINADLARRLRLLADDATWLRQTRSVSPALLQSAPFIDEWIIAQTPAGLQLIGDVTGHPRLRGRMAMTYRLGTPADPDVMRHPRGDKSSNPSHEQSLRRTLELVFHVHMEMADLANRVLAEHQLGRPHHRVLYFVVQQPGITVNELLSILRITNQALSRTINQLTRMDLIEQKPGQQDRRHRCNYPTPKGIRLCRQLTKLQYEHIEKSLAGVSRKDMNIFWDVLLKMVRDQDRAWITTSDD